MDLEVKEDLGGLYKYFNQMDRYKQEWGDIWLFITPVLKVFLFDIKVKGACAICKSAYCIRSLKSANSVWSINTAMFIKKTNKVSNTLAMQLSALHIYFLWRFIWQKNNTHPVSKLFLSVVNDVLFLSGKYDLTDCYSRYLTYDSVM